MLQFDSRERADAFARAVTETAMVQFLGLELFVKQLDYDENKTPGENLKALSAALDGGTGLEKGLFQKIDGVDRCLFFDGVELIDHGVDLEEVQA